MGSVFYQNNLTSLLNVIYSTDITIEQHLSELFLNNDLTRVEYASNEYAFRKRVENEIIRLGQDVNVGTAGDLSHLRIKSNYNLPFVNYYLTDFNEGESTWWNNVLYTRGAFISELNRKIKIDPVKLGYQVTLWIHRRDESILNYIEARFDADNKTFLEGIITIDGVDVPFPVWVNYTGLNFEPEYKENDWLERGKIRSISMDFEITTWIMKGNLDVCIPERILFNFASNHGFANNSYEKNLTFVINRFKEEVIKD